MYRYFLFICIAFLAYSQLQQTHQKTDFCIFVVPEAKSKCHKNAQEFIQQNTGQSSPLHFVNLGKHFARIKNDKIIFKPRKDAKEWPISIPVNWAADPFNDRNWRMSFLSLRALDPFFWEFQETQNPETLRSIFAYLLDWYTFHVIQKQYHRFAWYDMSVAYRADRLSVYMDWVSGHIELFNDSELFVLFHLCNLHIAYLTNSMNINPGNHGVFEIASVSRLCKTLPFFLTCNKQAWIKIKAEELTFNQFGEDGLHKEHSFGYHFFVQSTFKRLLKEGVFPMTKNAKERFQRSIDANYWLTDSDNTIASIGDTDFGARSKPYEKVIDTSSEQVEETSKLFQSSGLAVIKNSHSTLWFHGAYHSVAHKQDDDLSFFLFDTNYPLLIDGGKYAYSSGEKREYFLQRYAHNTVFAESIQYKQQKHPYGSAIQSLDQNGEIFTLVGEVQYKNATHRRKLIFSPNNSLTVEDFIDSKDKNIQINFLLGPDLSLQTSGSNIASFIYGSKILTIENNNKECLLETYYGTRDKNGKYRGWYSPGYFKMEPTWSLTYNCKNHKKKFSTVITYNISYQN
ncbi:MAG: heparinase II/III family protein [Bdellovibrionota bacterium]